MGMAVYIVQPHINQKSGHRYAGLETLYEPVDVANLPPLKCENLKNGGDCEK